MAWGKGHGAKSMELRAGAWGKGHGAKSMELRAWGKGHGAKSMGHRNGAGSIIYKHYFILTQN